MSCTSTIEGRGTQHQASATSGEHQGEQPRIPSVLHNSVFAWNEENSVTVLRQQAEARIRTAVSGIQTLSAVLMQREMDSELSGSEASLVFGRNVASGLLEAIACCAGVIEYALTDKVFTREVDVGSAEDRQIMGIAADRR